ncbi:hypothetical protein [Lusitaniella coriacea]|uniref:hypothetical protein n=1 Tax=Lusitaniella coriacea TaxID=1983105 RepID=UPI003CFA5F32
MKQNCSSSSISVTPKSSSFFKIKQVQLSSFGLSVLEGVRRGLETLFLKGSEPKIYQTRNSQGKLSFKVYDPIARQSNHFESEEEVRIWLEQRYYR